MDHSMTSQKQTICEGNPKQDFLIAIDSDGCVFDAMGIKQRECFCPMMIAYFGLQPVAEAARQCKEFADLFSKTRGANRHVTIARILTELLPSHPLVKKRNYKVPPFRHYVEWVNNPDSFLSNEGLKKAISESAQAEVRQELSLALTWSRRVNEMVAEIVRNIPPFPFVRESFEKISPRADLMVCSATPAEALEREWAEHGLLQYVQLIAGQERGSKTDVLAAIRREKYPKNHILMIGDAPSDQKAAFQNQVLFYPIIPGQEEISWKRFYEEASGKFFAHEYSGAYEKTLLSEFEQCLPEHPPWG